MTTSPTPETSRADALLTALIWCALMASALILRPLLPIDETRYISVAWEMFQSGDYWVPTKNGELYSHKPPFLFWLMNLGWEIFGVTEAWARLVAPLFGLGVLAATVKLAKELWPDVRADVMETRAYLPPLMLLTGLYWTVFATMTMFDMIVTFATVIAIWGYVKAWRGFVTGQGFWLGLLIAGVGLGLGGQAKGPAILVHTLPAALFAPLWGPALTHAKGESGWGKWYLGVVISLIVGVAVTLAWAIPAAIIGGEEYRNAIFIKQSADRVVQSFAHQRPFYWFVWVLPLMLLPWTVWPRLWKGIGARKAWTENRGLRTAWTNGGVRLLLIWSGVSFVIFSAISGKQPHYLLPVFPALALFAGYLLSTKEQAVIIKGHRVPVAVLTTIAAIIMVFLLAQDLIEPMLKKPLPEWAGAAEPIWLLPAVILGVAALFAKPHTPRAEVRLIAGLVTTVMVTLHMAAQPAFAVAYDLEHPAQKIKLWQDLKRPVLYVGKYHAEFQFLGRLERPIDTVEGLNEVSEWSRAHPNGVVIATMRAEDVPKSIEPLSVQPYRGKELIMWEATEF